MAFFTDLTYSLKQKWLQYFQENRSWIVRQMEVDHVATPDGGRRPSSFLILGVVSTLEPQLLQLLLPFARLNPNVDALIDVLDLNIDPEKARSDSQPTQNPSNPTTNPSTDMDALMGIAQDEPNQSTSRVEVVDRTTPGIQPQSSQPSTTQNQKGDVWLDELNQPGRESEQTPGETPTREQKKPEDDEISRLFPEF